MYLSQNIKFLRKTNSLTQAEFGDKLGIQASQITKYEKGTSDPPVAKLIQIADIFEVSLQDLVMTDLTTNPPQFSRPDKPYGTLDESGQNEMLERLNKELTKRILQLEDYVAKNDPDQARRWGIIE
jgi:transcriptional regulator with XRE-family HTH domain